MAENQYIIFTDGACIGNPGPGGIGVVIYQHGAVVETIKQGYYRTTNNRMELRACIEALKRYGSQGVITLYTDSTYVRRGVTEWSVKWQELGWKREVPGGNGRTRYAPVKNEDLWKTLVDLNGPHITWLWVKGHANDEGNETADRLAAMAARRGPFLHDLQE